MGLFSKSKPDPNTEIKLNNNNWQLFFRWMEQGENELPIMMFFDETYAENQPKDYKFGVELSVFVPNDDDHIYPETVMLKEHVNQDFIDNEELMQTMIEEANSHTKLTAKLVGIGRKVYRFQTRDLNQLIPILEKWTENLKYNRKAETESRKDWTYYTGILPNLAERQQISDRVVIESALENGANEEELYKCDFTFSGAENNLKTIQKDLGEEEFIMVKIQDGELILQRPLPLDLKTVSHFTSYMLMSAMSNDSSFNGWGCHISLMGNFSCLKTTANTI